MKESQISAITFFEILFTILAIAMFMLLGVAPLRGFGLVFATMVFALAAMAHSFMEFSYGQWISLVFFVISLSIFGVAWMNLPAYL